MSLEQNIIAVTPKRQSVELNKHPFHMLGTKIVCNVCGENFTNLVLFGNHTHRADQKQNNMPSQRSGPKPDHKTFNTMSEEEMVEAFHKMPELEGCWIENGRYICNMCGKSCPNPYVLFGHKIIHPEDMTPFSRGKETDFQQTQGVSTQTTIERGLRDRKRNHKRKLIKDQEKRLKKVRNISCESDNEDVEGDDDDNVKNLIKVKKPMTRPMKKLKVKTQETHLYKTLISVDRKSTAVKSKPPSEQIAMEPGKKSKPSTGGEKTDLGVSSDSEDEEDSTPSDSDVDGDSIGNQSGRTNQKLETSLFKKKEPMTHVYRSLIAVKGQSLVKPMKLCVSSDSEDEEYDSTPSDSDVDGDSIGNQPGRPNQKLETSQFKKKETQVYRSLIAFKGQSFVKPMKPPPYEYCLNMFGHKFLDKCKLMKGRYYCDECSSLYSSPYLLLNHKLYHAKHKYLNRRRAAQESTTGKKEEAQVGTMNKKDEAQVGTMNKKEEAVGTMNKKDEAQVGTTGKDEEAQVEEDGMCFECNMCQVMFDSSDGLADHIEAHAADTQAGTSRTFSDSTCADVCKASTSACSTEMTDHVIVVTVKEEPITDYEDEGNAHEPSEPEPEPSGLDPSVTIKQEAEPSSLPQHSSEEKIQTDDMDVQLAAKLFLKRIICSPVVRVKRIEIQPNEVYIVK